MYASIYWLSCCSHLSDVCDVRSEISDPLHEFTLILCCLKSTELLIDLEKIQQRIWTVS